MSEKRSFDNDAPTWDEEPRRVQLAHNVAQAILTAIPLDAAHDVLDFGCGTGLVALEVLPRVHAVTGVDSSRGMLEVLEKKARTQGLRNLHARHLNLDAGDHLEGRYDAVISSMTLHHIADIHALFQHFAAVLVPGGWLAVADLDLDGGLFHENSDGVYHNGFDRAALAQLLTESGFEQTHCTTAAEVTKPTATGEPRTFPIFLLTARRTSK